MGKRCDHSYVKKPAKITQNSILAENIQKRSHFKKSKIPKKSHLTILYTFFTNLDFCLAAFE